MSEPVDRRGFLVSAGAAGLAVACGARAPAAKLRPRAPRTLAQAIRGHVFGPSTPGFHGAAHVYNTRFDGILPHAVARPVDGLDVRAAVRWAVGNGVRIRARSGGHSYAGYSTFERGVVLDLRRLSSIRVDRRHGTASIGAGAQLIDVYATLAAHGVTLPGGSCPSVGITGVTLGGGFGLAGRAFGLSADNLIGVDIVTADGRLRHVDQHRDPDLLWALRGGGGGNFGVVTNLHFRVHPLPRSAARFSVAWPWSEASTALDAWQHWAPHTRDQITAVFHLQTGVHAPSVVAAGQYLGPASDLPRLLAPLTSVPGASLSTRDHDYLTLQQIWAGCATQSLASCHTVGAAPHGTLLRANFRAKSDYVNRALPAAARARLVSAIEQRQAIPGGSGAILFDSYGGAINRVAPGATAFVHRSVLFCIQYLTYDAGTSWLRQTYAGVRPYMSGGAYQNYIDSELRTWRHAYYGANYKRLVATQRRVDRHHFFSFPQAIGS